MMSFSGFAKVSGSFTMKRQLISPRMPGGNQLFTPIEEENVVTNGERVLPIIPITLVHPYPRLRI